MNGFGGLRPLEAGQSAAKAAGDTAKQQTKQWIKAAATQITGKPIGQNSSGNQGQQPKSSDTLGDFGKLFEQNQSQQNPSGNPAQQPTPRPSHEAEFKEQNQQDQNKLAAARNELQKLEQEMAEIKRKREEAYAQQNQEEEEEKKMEDLEEKQQNQQPVRAGSPNPEGGKKKG
ncbi:MAG TPA: hypothetical protein VLG12_05870 [Candidatus Saccharimonadales bacterium]|nr:hypothetical protein [Candidatus Saccharimonadales bacterium]